MKIKKVILYHVDLPMKFKFITSKEALSHRETLILKVFDEKGNFGFGEAAAFTTPFYTAETLELDKKALLEEYIPEVLGKEILHPFDVHSIINHKLPMATAGVENALLDLYFKNKQTNIISSIFKEELMDYADMGMVLGDIAYEELFQRIEEYEKQGCRRFKIKVKPEDGYIKVKKAVESFPKLHFAVDANRSYSLSQAEEVKKFDSLNLLCIEEPFSFSSFEDIHGMQEQIKTPICLDESIQTMEDLNKAFSFNTFKVLNIKIGRLGGLYYAKQMIDFCRKNKLHYWIGSMVESGISKILHLQLSSLSDVYMPGDFSDSKRYFEEDIIEPELEFINGKMRLPKAEGLGVKVNEDLLLKRTIKSWEVN